MKNKFIHLLFGLLISIVVAGCSGGASEADLKSAIDSGNIEEVKSLVSANASYSLLSANLMQYAHSKHGVEMAEVIASTKMTQADIEFLTNKGMEKCIRNASGDDKEDYCKCSLGKLYTQITYLDLMDGTSNLKSAMASSAKDCL